MPTKVKKKTNKPASCITQQLHTICFTSGNVCFQCHSLNWFHPLLPCPQSLFSSSASLFLPCRLVHSVAWELILPWTLWKPKGMRWDRVGREAQEGDICVLMSDSRCCMAETSTLEAIILQLKIKKPNKQTASFSTQAPVFKFCLFKRVFTQTGI